MIVDLYICGNIRWNEYLWNQMQFRNASQIYIKHRATTNQKKYSETIRPEGWWREKYKQLDN